MTTREREELIITHLPRVHWLAARIHDRLCWMANFEDLVSMGIIGLIAAVDRYDPSYGVRLQTYADYKIRGAILDTIRSGDGVPARSRNAARRLRRSLALLEQRLGRPAAEDEAAAEMGLPVDDYRKLVERTRAVRLRSLDDQSHVGDRLVRLRDVIPCGEENQPSWPFERAELRGLVKTGIAQLPEVQQLVITSYFLEGRSLREIAEQLEVHVTRVSQIKIQAIGRLRAYVLKHWLGRKGSIEVADEPGKRTRTLMAC